MSKDKNKILIWLPRLALALLVCALFSTATLSGYVSTVSGTGTVRIATVELDGALDVDVSGLAPGETKSVGFSVVNSNNGVVSDVSQIYVICIETTGNLPLTFSISSADSSADGHALTAGANNTWTGGAFPHTTRTEHTYSLNVTWDSAYNDPKYVDEIDAIKLIVDAQQRT